MHSNLKKPLIAVCVAVAMLAVVPAQAMLVAERAADALPESGLSVVQRGNCVSLSEAVESIRRRGNVERIISATTRVSGGREVHHIRVMTRDGRVQTHRVQGCRRN